MEYDEKRPGLARIILSGHEANLPDGRHPASLAVVQEGRSRILWGASETSCSDDSISETGTSGCPHRHHSHT